MGSELRTQNPELRTDLDPRILKLLADVEQKWGRGALVRLGDGLERAEIEVIPTGFPVLDEALGIGGLPCGRISEIFGPDSSGKHALATHLMVQCQQAEGVAAYIDLDGRLDPEQMRSQGVDFHSLLVARPKGYLQALEMAIRLARSGGIKLLIFDVLGSVGADGPYRTQSTGLKTALGLALRRLVSAVDKNAIAFVFLTSSTPCRPAGDKPLPYVSELRAQNPALGTQHSKGGQALRFFASVRLGMERREWIRRGRDVMGCRTLVQVAKNKLAPPLKEAEVELLFYRFPPAAPLLQISRPGQQSRPGFWVPSSRSQAASAGR